MAKRKLLAFYTLPPRDGLLDRAQVDTDVREGMAVLATKLQHGTEIRGLTTTGWTAGEVEYEHVGEHTLRGTIEVTRND